MDYRVRTNVHEYNNERLEQMGLEEGTKRILKIFIDVTDLFGQIYVTCDIASRMK